jgi:hypothetical protein
MCAVSPLLTVAQSHKARSVRHDSTVPPLRELGSDFSLQFLWLRDRSIEKTLVFF